MSQQEVCPLGFKCNTTGLCNATACPLGTFVSCPGKVRCDTCSEGRYCPNVSTSLLCPANFYCPPGTYNPIPCGSGKHSNVGSKNASQCTSSSRRMIQSNHQLTQDDFASSEAAGGVASVAVLPGQSAMYSVLTLVALSVSGMAVRMAVARIRRTVTAKAPTSPQ
jgi:hypothetical protein